MGFTAAAIVPPRVVEFSMPIRTASLANEHAHWRQRQKRAKAERTETWATWLEAKGRRLQPNETAVVHLTRVAPSRLDDDNLPVSMKSIRDQLAADLGVDDRSARVAWRYEQERGPYAVKVRVEIHGAERP